MGDRRRTEFGRPRNLRYALLLGCAGVSLAASPAEAGRGLPTGGHFVAGVGGISPSGDTTTITQSSSRGIIDWTSFSIGKGDTVQFDNGSGATLNRVTGGNLSTIAGQLKATGSVYLINQNGVLVGPDGKVVTGGTFVASTRDTGNGAFMAGGNQFFTGTSNGAVVNDGAVVSQSGSVVLIGHSVTNSGTIDAANGTATLASGNRVLMTDASGPGGIYVAGKGGNTSNDGQVKAAAVELAATGGNVYALAGNRTGLIRATGTKTVDGQVWLTAPDGKVDVGGTVAAANADGSGGTIMAKGASLNIADKAVLNAAGRTGRGTIETSGKAVSIGKAKVTAGQKGKWVIDPTDLTIDTPAATAIDLALNAGTSVTEQTTSTVAVGIGTQAPGHGDIKVEAAISWSSSATLTLEAFNDVDIDQPITGGGSSGLVLQAGQAITIGSSLTAHSFSADAGATGTINLAFGNGQTVTTSGGGQTYKSPIILVDLGTLVDTGNGPITFSSTVDAAVAAGVAIDVEAGNGVVTFSGAVGGSKSLDGFTATGTTTLDGNVSSNNPIVFNGSVTLGATVALSSNDKIDFNATVDGNFGLSASAPFASVIFAQPIGQTTPLASLTVTAQAITLNSGSVTTTGAQSFNSPMTLGASTTLTSTANSAISLAATDGAFDLAVNTGGTTTFGGAAIGGTTPLTSVSVNGSGPIVINTASINTTGDQFYQGPVTLSTNTTLTSTGGGAIDFEGTVDGAFGLTMSTSGAGTLAAAVGGTTPLASLKATGGTLGLGGNITTTGQQTLTTTGVLSDLDFNGSLTAGSTITLTATGSITQVTGNITAGMVTGSAGLSVDLGGNDAISHLGAFTSAGQFVLTNTVALTQVAGTTVDAGAGAIVIDNGSAAFTQSGTLTTTNASAAAIQVDTTGALSVGTISAANGTVILGNMVGASDGGPVTAETGAITAVALICNLGPSASLSGNNAVGSLSFNGLPGVSTGNLSFTDTVQLTVSGLSGVNTATLTTTGVSGITLAGSIVLPSALTLESSGTITQTGGSTFVGTLGGSSVGGTTLNGSNHIQAFENFTNSTGGDISVKNSTGLTAGGLTTPDDLTLNATALTLDGSLAVGSGRTVTLTSTGPIDQTGGIITAGTLTGSVGSGAVILTTNNQVDFLGAWSASSALRFSFTDARALTTTGTVSSGGPITLTTTGGTSSSLTLGADVTATGNTVTLTSTGTISQTGGSITAGTLTGTSVGATTLNGANAVGTLTGFQAGGALSFTDSIALTTTGSILAGTGGASDLSLTAPSMNLMGNGTSWSVSAPGNVTLTTTTGDMTLGAFESATGTLTLNSAGQITENTNTGNITAGTLSGSSVGGANLAIVNVSTLAGFANTGGGDLYIADTAPALTVTAAVSTASGATLSLVNFGTLTLTATSSLSAPGANGIVALGKTGAGSITQANGSVITAGTLEGQANGGVSLGGANQVGTLGAFTNTGSGDIDFTDAQALTVGAVSNIAGNIALDTASGGMTLNGDITATGHLVTLISSGEIQQNSGTLTAGTLTGSAVNGAIFASTANQVATFGPFSNIGGTGIMLNDAASTLTISGAIVGVGQNVTFNGPGSGGTIIQAAGSVITAGRLGGTNYGGTLGGNNAVIALSWSAGNSGAFSFTDSQTLEVDLASSSNGTISLTTVGAGNGITIAGNSGGTNTVVNSAGVLIVNGGATLGGSRIDIAATSIELDSATLGQGGSTIDLAHGGAVGDITETGTGAIVAGTLLASHGVTGIVSLGGVNQIADLGAMRLSTGGDAFTLNDITALTISGPLSTTTAPISVTTTGAGSSVTITGTISTADTLTLISADTIGESGAGAIAADTLTGSSAGGAILAGINTIASFTGFTNGAGGTVSLTDKEALTVSGITSRAGGITLTTTGSGSNLTVAGAVTATHTVDLAAAGTIDQTGGTITAALLTGSAGGSAALTGSNKVTAIGPFTVTGDFDFSDLGANLTVVGAVSASGNLTLSSDLAIDSALSGTTVSLLANGGITERAGGSIAATNLVAVTELDSGGAITLNRAGANTVTGTITLTALNGAGTALAAGAIDFTGSGAVTIASGGGLRSGIATTGSATVDAGGKLTIAAGATVTGDAVALATSADFVNDQGAGAVTATGGGRWLIYSAAPAGDVFGGLDSHDTAIWGATYGTLPPASVAAGGDHYIFAQGQTLTVTTTNVTKTYGQDAAAGVASAYTISGFAAGVADAYLGDTAASVFSGTPVANSAGSAVSASVAGGPYAITGTTGSLVMKNGYTVVFANTGLLTIDPATLTYTAGTATRSYGSANPVFGGTVTGFVAGDTLASATTGSLRFTSPATATSNVGSYAIDGSGLIADHGDYVFVQASGNLSALTINPAMLTVTANDVTTTYDRTAFSGGGGVTYSGFVNGQTSAVLGGTLAYGGTAQGAIDAGSYDIIAHGLTSGNYAIVYDGGTLTIDPKLLTAVLTGTVTKIYDGTTVAILTDGNYMLTGVIAGDTVTLNDPANGAYATAAVGSGIAVTVGGLKLLGAEAGDYRLASVTATADIGTITAAVPPPPSALFLPTTPFIPVVPPRAEQAEADSKAAATALNSIDMQHPAIDDIQRLSGCAGEDFVAVVPEANGHVGAVVVETQGNRTLLHSAYAACSGYKPVVSNADEIGRMFGAARAARPTPPATYQLYYDTGSVTLTPDALAVFDKVFAEIMQRKAAEVVVAGYTDTVGTMKHNDMLSRERAQSAAKLLLARGVASDAITTLGRGERDLLVPTKDQVPEQKNRRVEITVR